jgi:hypothetical protein
MTYHYYYRRHRCDGMVELARRLSGLPPTPEWAIWVRELDQTPLWRDALVAADGCGPLPLPSPVRPDLFGWIPGW